MLFIQKILKSKLWLLWLLIIATIVISISSYQFGKIDLTQEKRYTLSNATKEMLGNLNEDIEVEVFLDGELSSGFRKLKIATKELLDEYRDYSKGKLHFIIHKPGAGLNDSAKLNLYDSLIRLGIKPFNNQIKEKDEETQTERLIFPAALVKTNSRMYAVDLMSGKSGMDEESTLNYSEALLEFKFDDAIDKITKTEFPIVAYATGNGEPFNPTVKSLFDVMRNNYRFGVMDLNAGILNADTIKALLIVKPSQAFTEQEKIKIDQYIMHGGKVIWLIDKLEASFDSLLRKKSDFVAFDKGLNLDDILFKYGVRINPDLLQDLNCARQPLVVGNMGGKPQIERVPFPYYPLLTSPSNHPISKNLDFVLSIFPSSIDTVKTTDITKTILLSTDTSSRTLGTPAIVSLQSIASDDDLKTFNKSHVPVAVLLEGKFNSLYANRFTNAMKDSIQKLTDASFLTTSKPTQQIVISDGDLVTNVITESKGTLPMGTQQFEEYTFANKDFIINCMDYLVGNVGIMQTRNKEITLRLLNKNKLQEDKTLWQVINIGLPIFLILILGITLQWQRKKKFAA
ncbi:MAG: gliding motility-associated ABC transporter substrate-binding protein GldG [Bacteroidetes bacterium]|nr:gliding motility-associated ABC transporter substrate-binding protein GldG [Bacteroidota bacterium]MBS1670674.1 gliding motility-associated ABC transporter substrate-binding protein GldG [Bacteroidota bacterium]